MKAVRIIRGQPLAPFGDVPGALPVLNTPLATVQEEALAAAGLELVDEAPAGEPHLVFSDRTWFSAECVRRLLAAGPGRLCVDDPAFLATTGPLQELPRPGLYELAVHPGDGRPFDEIDSVVVDLGLTTADPPVTHPKLAHVVRPLRLGLALVHQIDHWTHLLRVNHLALALLGLELKDAFDRAPWWRKAGQALGVLARARSVQPEAIGAALTVRGGGARVHPTAVVEASQLGPDVEIGAFAVVRGCIVGAGTRIEEHTTALGSVFGTRCILSRYAMANLCVLQDEAQLSTGGGWQFSLVGKRAFVAWGATGLDLSFGRPIQVEHNGERVSTEHHLLGVCVGHDAVLANNVRLHHGVAVPNGAFVVAHADDLLRYPGRPEGNGPFVVEGGRLVPIRRRKD